MRRIRDRAENESVENAHKAYDNFSDHKHNRDYVKVYEARLQENLELAVRFIVEESWTPEGYKEKVIFEKKFRKLAKAPVMDHVVESATILPYEKQIYDYSTWRAPAVKPGLGTHGLFRMLRNELRNHPQEDMMYYVPMDVHHYFPLMDHAILKEKLQRLIKPGKLLRFCFKVVDSYTQGVPLGIKVAQLFGQVYLADFDRLAMRFFDIGKDPEKMAYWTRRYIEGRIVTARSPDDYRALCRGPSYLAWLFRRYVDEGLPFYIRFVDNILIRHGDKTVLHIATELSVMHLERDWHCTVNSDYNVRPVWMGIRIVGYVFHHDGVLAGKQNKKNLARRVSRLRKKGFSEEQIRIRLSSRFGYIKHADCIHLLKRLGMEKSLGKIIKSRRVKAPFPDMNGSQKVKFSSICNKCDETAGEKKREPVKIYLEDYKIMNSKIDKEKVMVKVEKADGSPGMIEQSTPQKALAIRFKRILKTFTLDGEESYVFEKKKDEQGNPTDEDAEYYSFTGSKILIDQALNDFTIEDLPYPTIIQQFTGKNGQTFVKFT